ncbi:MAG: bifunctional hydroxymethylpyrimidine kinase/phosphomethylpyrimidine kinase [Nannocystaceae bacterium]|nr:bifunctional hydroxymethylpyrimidine kinase/phosphomethylpyrimidine kinase [bacterium]
MVEGALWVIGGLDPSAGAGVLRDVATARAVAPGRVVHAVVTALTQQGDGRPAVAGPMNAEAMRFQLLRAPEPAAVKIGLVPASVVGAIAEVLEELDVPCVLDPVLGASAGGSMAASPEALLPLMRGAMVTPNAREYDRLIGGADPEGWIELNGASAVLRKGGHDRGEQVSDTLWTRDGARVFSRRRVPGADPRGTGCALATAIACALADGSDVGAAVGKGIAWLDSVRGAAREVGGQVLLP